MRYTTKTSTSPMGLAVSNVAAWQSAAFAGAALWSGLAYGAYLTSSRASWGAWRVGVRAGLGEVGSGAPRNAAPNRGEEGDTADVIDLQAWRERRAG